MIATLFWIVVATAVTIRTMLFLVRLQVQSYLRQTKREINNESRN